jgi:hypothetical protein
MRFCAHTIIRILALPLRGYWHPHHIHGLTPIRVLRALRGYSHPNHIHGLTPIRVPRAFFACETAGLYRNKTN